MKKVLPLIITFMMLVSCAGKSAKPDDAENTNNFVTLYRIGIVAEDRGSNLTVTAVSPSLPAMKAGIKVGDVIVTVNGNKFTIVKEFLTYLEGLSGEHVLLVVQRNGVPVTFDIEPLKVKIRPTILKIRNLLLDGQRVSLLIYVDQVKNNARDVPYTWEESVRNNLQSEAESGYINNFSASKKFSIVDRAIMSRVLDEIGFTMTGLTSKDTRVKVGEMTGATHILSINSSRFVQTYTHKVPFGVAHTYCQDDVFNYRLISLESGNVLAVDTSKNHKCE